MPIPSHSGIFTGSPKAHSAMLLRQNLDAIRSSPSATCNSMDRGPMNFKCNLRGTMSFVVDNEMFWPSSVVSTKQILYHNYTLSSSLCACYYRLHWGPRPLRELHIHSRNNQSIATDCRMFRPCRPSSSAYKTVSELLTSLSPGSPARLPAAPQLYHSSRLGWGNGT